MTALLYYLFILPLSFLPTRILHLISDGLYVVVYRVLGYRKRVVLENLRRSFPEKTEEEIRRIASEFFRHFCDIIVESFRAFSISNEEILRRFVVENPEVLNRHYERGKDVVLAGGHYNNWEWLAVALDQQVKHQAIAIYKPLSNRFFERKMKETRSRFGLQMVPIKAVPETFAAPSQGPRAFIFGVDQSPGNASKAHWMRFLHQDTAVQFGSEKYAKEHDLPVVYGVIRKIGRGQYRLHFTEVTDQPGTVPHGGVVEQVTRMLEAEIIRAPQFWLWSHRRWKHSRPADAKSVSRELLEAPQ